MKPRRERRADRRVAGDKAHVLLGGRRYTVRDISFGGIAVHAGHEGRFRLGERVRGRLCVPTLLAQREFAFAGRVVRIAGGVVAVHFDRPEYALMANIRQHFVY